MTKHADLDDPITFTVVVSSEYCSGYTACPSAEFESRSLRQNREALGLNLGRKPSLRRNREQLGFQPRSLSLSFRNVNGLSRAAAWSEFWETCISLSPEPEASCALDPWSLGSDRASGPWSLGRAERGIDLPAERPV